jgi:hypothetical protein
MVSNAAGEWIIENSAQIRPQMTYVTVNRVLESDAELLTVNVGMYRLGRSFLRMMFDGVSNTT